MIHALAEAGKNTKNAAEVNSGYSVMVNIQTIPGKMRDLLLCLLSVVFLVFSFPQVNWFGLAFVALVPLFFAIDGKTLKQSFQLSYKVGWLFFLCVLYWITLVPPEVLTFFGLLALVGYLSLYFGLFGMFYYWSRKHPPLLKLFILPGVWTVLEFVRGHFLSGFGWASLCHSQSDNLLLIQISDVTGMLGVSFFIVFVNVFVKECLDVFLASRNSQGQQKCPGKSLRIVFVTVVVVVFAYGQYCLTHYPARFESGVKIAVIQGNISQSEKLNQSLWDRNYLRYKTLTLKAVEQRPDLIIWPETALPGYINWDDTFLIKVRDFVKEIKIPVLLGTVENEGDDFYNIALLITQDGEIVEKYRKMHLVPFGEFIPLRSTFPVISSIIPIGDFSASDVFTVFNAKKKWMKDIPSFAVQICFEDAVPQMVREYVNRSADFLVNITNDAWFKDTKAPFLHLQSSVFRAVENRKTLVRAANTGVSGFISPVGKVYQVVQSSGRGSKRTFVEGFSIGSVYLNQQDSVYSRGGDFFVFLCLGISLLGFAGNYWREKF